jgi:hypothetical protein
VARVGARPDASWWQRGIPPLRTFEIDPGLEPLGEHSLWAIETFYALALAALWCRRRAQVA